MLLRHYLRLIRLGFYFPYFLYEAFKDWAETSRRRRLIRATREAYVPRPLPARRSRALTNASTGYDTQQESPLFSKLPAELRLQVYQHALTAHRVIHIAIWNKKYWHRTCKYHPASVVLGAGYLHACWAEPLIEGDKDLHRSGDPLHLHTNEKTSDGLLSLLLACHRVYIEAVDQLYSCNRFNVHRAATVAHLPRSLLPQRLQQIRYMELDIPISRFISGAATTVVHPDDAGQWKWACEVLKMMKGLRRLIISLSIHGLHNWSSAVVYYYLTPLTDISHVDHFIVHLPRVVGRAEMAGLGDVPFDVVYHNENDDPSLSILQQELLGGNATGG